MLFLINPETIIRWLRCISLRSIAIVFGYWNSIKYSINVLAGVVERFFFKEPIDLYLVSSEELLDFLSEIPNRYGKHFIYAQSILTAELPKNKELFMKATRLVRKYGGISVAGGPHPSGDPYGTILSLGFDYVVVGEAEETFKSFLFNYINDLTDLEPPTGVASLVNGKVKLRGKGFVQNLNEYLPFSLGYRLYNPIEISRGCPFACKYCQVSYVFGASQRHRDIDEVVKWSSHLLRIGIKDIRFITPNALGYGSRNNSVSLDSVEELLSALQQLRNRGGRVYLGTFPSEIRPEHICDEAAKMLRKYVNNKRVVIGAQTGSRKLLEFIHRGHTSEDVINAVQILRKYGFGVDVDYIFGLPGEDEEDIEETIKHMQKVIKLGGRIHAHVFMPLPGTPFAMSPPGKVPKKVLKVLNRFLGKGRVFGQWMHQERLANEIAKLRDEGIILLNSTRAKEVMRSSPRKT